MTRFCLLGLGCFGFACLGSVWLEAKDLTLVFALVWPAAGIVAGVLIGAVAVVLGTIARVEDEYIERLVANQKADGFSLTKAQERTLRQNFMGALQELKQDAMFALAVIPLLTLVTCWGVSDLPYVQWPQAPWMISKIQAVHGVALFLLGLVMLAAWDALKSMFVLAQLDGGSSGVDA